MLKLFREQRSTLKGGQPESADYDPGLAVALFGTAALVGAEYTALRQWYPRPDSGSGCGSGCSSTGGGSGCGGSGCGGCGGGGD